MPSTAKILLTVGLALLPIALTAGVRVIDIAPVWSGHPVSFDLLNSGKRQFVAFYDAERRMTVGARDLGSSAWQFVNLPSQVGWDSHNSLVLAADREGHLHLAGNMHVVPLVYFRSEKPWDIESFVRRPMTGERENRVTYPQFIQAADGRLTFTYRDGSSGNGSQIWNVYDEPSRAWRRLLDQPLTDGQGRMNAYFVGPKRGPDGWFHLVGVWRDTPDCSTNHDLSYARSRDLVQWETAAGKPLALPLRVDNIDIIDAVPPRGGMINGNTKLGWDSQSRPVITYHKFDAAGNTQLHNARLENGTWKIYQTTQWDYRWYFQGGGSINFEITFQPVLPVKGGLRLDYSHAKHGAGSFLLDTETLKVIGTLNSASPWPVARLKVESAFPGMEVRTEEFGKYLLRWETLPRHRDRPRDPPYPEPSMLRLYELIPDTRK
jgi:hypothetical protein